MATYERVKARLDGEDIAISPALLAELCDLAQTRITLRVGERYFPEILEPIAADVAVKLYRRVTYEGIASEGADKITTSFVENILDEYADDLDAYKSAKDSADGVRRVKFY